MEKIKRREFLLEKHKKNLSLIENKNIECTYAVNTILINGDAVGLIIIYSNDEKLSDVDFNIIKIVSNFLERYLSN